MNTPKSSISALMATAALMAGCAQQPADPNTTADAQIAEPTERVELGAPFKTIKPGASVSFTHAVSDPVRAGENASVTLTLNEGYPTGTLYLTATGDEGLDVFGAEVSTQKDMSSGTTHTWRVDVSAEVDGLYYLKVYATAEPEPGFTEARGYSVRIEVGDWQAASAKTDVATAMKTLDTGEAAVILEAEETIE